ncbi:TonB-dependent receptor [Polymorphobacter sp.]|uniref:TonB-dependent receptor n=1 Tax=Polymorphobacter sp. TaxID=1909290 RepID=UPI003F71834F
MHTNKTLALVLRSTATAALALSGTAYAQAPAEEANAIVVTARKVEERTQDIPVAVTAFTARDIQRRSINELEDVALLTPGLVFEDYSNGGFGTPTIRGATQFAITALEQNVSVFLDGIYIPRQYAFDLGSVNLERIEVVKGPQTALYGANAFAGAINYITASRSLTQLSAQGTIEASQWGGFDVNGKVNLPVIDGKLSVRAAGGYSRFGGDWKNSHPQAAQAPSPGTDERTSGYEKYSAQIGFSARPVEALTIEADYYHFNTETESRAQFRITRGNADTNCSLGTFFGQPSNALFCGQIPSVPIPGPSGTQGIVVDPRTYGLISSTDAVRVNVALDITDKISANYLYGHIQGDVFSLGNSDRDPISAATNTLIVSPGGNFNYDTHEARLQYADDKGLLVMLGGFLLDGKDREDVAFAAFPKSLTTYSSFAELRAAGVATTATQIDTKLKAVFGRIAIPMLEGRLTFEAEGRYTDEDKTITEVNTGRAFKFKDSYFTPRFNLGYKITDNNLVYGSVAKGLKSGGVNTSSFAGLIPDERFYGPDTNWTYEIGVKNSFMGGRGVFNLALFQINWGDLQLATTPTGAPANTPTIVTNLGSAKSKGVEIDGLFEVVEGLTLNAGLAYIDAKYDEGTISNRITRANLCNPAICRANGDISGNELQRTSKWQWNIGASAEGPITETLEWFGRVDVAGQSRQFTDEINTAWVEPRTLTNVRLGIGGDRWSASVWAKNLFDKKYASNAFFIANPFQSDYVPTLGNRRRIGATLTFNY